MGKTRLRVLSTCSGISAASTAWSKEEFEFVGYADIDSFASEWLHQRRGCGRPRYMPSPDEAGLSDEDVAARSAAMKAVRHLPIEGTVPNFGDFTQISDDDLRALGRVDVLEGGTPCQDFSVAGLRAGIEGDRGNLTLEFIKLAKRMEAFCGTRYIVWENVPGVLTAPNAFGAFLAGLAGGCSRPLQPAGRSWDRAGLVDGPEAAIAWRVLDAQFFGVAQRRERVFAVGRLGADDVADPPGLLFECHGVPRDSPPSRRTGEVGPSRAGEGSARDLGLSYGIADYSTVSADLAPTLQSRMTAGGRMDAVAFPVGVALTGHAEYVADNDSLPSLRASGGDCGGGSEALVVTTHGAEDPDGTLCASGAGTSRSAGQANELDFRVTHSVAFSAGNSAKARGIGFTEEATPPLRAGASGTNQVPTIASAISCGDDVEWVVRRLTPTECERLQGFPDGHTAIMVRGKPAADTPRYRALGNSMAVPCMRFIGERLAAAHAEALEYARKAA